MLVKAITWFGGPAVLACDGKCSKAWGINTRPHVQLSDNPDDYAYLADDELGEAPEDPGTYEGSDAKPTDYDDPHRQNKWCARECERSKLVVPAGVVTLSDFGRRVKNIPDPVPAGKAQADAELPSADVYSRPECRFHYCPYTPEICQAEGSCQHPTGEGDGS